MRVSPLAIVVEPTPPPAKRAARRWRIIPTLAVVAALWAGQVLLIPIVLSILISYALEPLVSRLGRWHVPRALAAPILLIALLGALGAGAYVLQGEAAAFLDRLPVAAHTVPHAIQKAPPPTPGTASKPQPAP